MTTYDTPRFGAYPTAPPWAAAAEQSAVAAPPEPFIATTFPQASTGLVEEHTAPKTQPAAPEAPAAPSVLPIAILTVLFSVLGAIPAVRMADAAARDGHPRNPYWVTFAMAMVVNTLILTSVAMTMMLPATR